ncbi:MAG TPA: LytTR family transcriptional regulator DNA-binding domain-containing protein [Bacteroidia bacterium]|jgi:two-component system LytT family response regulator|nr:LytTR family transcriptional regulator DNA-binding domain-containing protein [Bacteroidia bacterium]
MIKTIIIDDEPLARQIVKEYLSSFPELEVVQECADGFEGIKAIGAHQPGLVFLDIQMPKINGFEMLELLDQVPPIIFTTAFDEYAVKAFETHAIDYLLKPFAKERFDKAIRKWMDHRREPDVPEKTLELLETAAHQPDQQQRVVVKSGNKVRIIPIPEIHYFEADDDYVKVQTQEGSYLKNKTMAWFEQALDPSQFVRVHRSFIVQVQQITRIEPYEKDSHLAILKSGARIPVSKTGYPKLKTVLGL